MSRSRLEEAMRPTRYNEDIPTKQASADTGLADQKPIDMFAETPRLPVDPAAKPSHVIGHGQPGMPTAAPVIHDEGDEDDDPLTEEQLARIEAARTQRFIAPMAATAPAQLTNSGQITGRGQRQVRHTTTDDMEEVRESLGLMDETETGPSPERGRQAPMNGPDPFPLQYRTGDPTGSFRIDGQHG